LFACYNLPCTIHLCFPFQVGPLRCWPGGLCLSRSIGDIDVGECIIPVPHVKQVKVYSYENTFPLHISYFLFEYVCVSGYSSADTTLIFIFIQDGLYN
jgi:hypothetical protein